MPIPWMMFALAAPNAGLTTVLEAILCLMAIGGTGMLYLGREKK